VVLILSPKYVVVLQKIRKRNHVFFMTKVVVVKLNKVVKLKKVTECDNLWLDDNGKNVKMLVHRIFTLLFILSLWIV